MTPEEAKASAQLSRHAFRFPHTSGRRLGKRVSLATVPLLGFTVAAATAGMTKSKG